MALVQSVDYLNLRIYLSAATVDSTIDTLDIYKEVRELRRITEAHRMFPPMIIAGGNIPKIPNVSYTAPYVIFLRGCRLVPYNVTHDLKVIRDTFTDDGFSGRDVFDRTPLSPTTHINIDFEVPQVEVRVVTVNTGSGLTTEQDAILRNAESASLIASAESSKARKMQTNKAVISPDDLIVTIYDDDKTSPLHVFDISLDKKARVPQ